MKIIKKTFKTQSDEIAILKNELDNAKFWGKLTATGLVMGLIGIALSLGVVYAYAYVVGKGWKKSQE